VWRFSAQRHSENCRRKKNQENKGEKMVMLYDYLTGNEFSEAVESDPGRIYEP
jgi:hypothetical protein